MDDDRVQVIHLQGTFGEELCQPVEFCAAFPESETTHREDWRLYDSRGCALPTQTRTIAVWPDGSTKWLSVLGFVSKDVFESKTLSLRPVASNDKVDDETESVVSTPDNPATITTDGNGVWQLGAGERVFAWTSEDASTTAEARLSIVGQHGKLRVEVVQNFVEEQGPLRDTIAFTAALKPHSNLSVHGRIRLYHPTQTASLELTLRNSSRAHHPGGYWDLGDPGSSLLRSVTLEVSGLEPCEHICWQAEPKASSQTTEGPWEIYQDSSGGENWNSRNHVDRTGEIATTFRGYRLVANGHEVTGDRASPVVRLRGARTHMACALTEFWQKFPSGIRVNGGDLHLELLPTTDRLHEIQGGEQITRCLWLAFSSTEQRLDDTDNLAWVHRRISARCETDQIHRSEAIPWLPNATPQPRVELRQLLHKALEGDHSFFAKREVIDEYGWRNFGDLWADHEEEHAEAGERPVISHYNNQYDPLYGFLVQYLVSGDLRWWQLGAPLANHLMDIDVYRTHEDKAGYCGGMFWHTAHYHDAGTATHRSMSRMMQGKAMPAPGGGPGNEHIYSSGLLLYYYLTGDENARQTVETLANYVIAMDDGRQHLLGLVSDTPTGAASVTRDVDFHGPGRGAGNAINTLLDGWLATTNLEYLAKAEELIRRTIHPDDDIDRLDLLDAENRWSYTVYLQTIGKLLETIVGIPSMTECSLYAHQSLLRYAHWMADNERPYLAHPEQLEFPNETWPAQDLRKGNVLLMAAAYESEGPNRDKLFRRGIEILDAAWRSLMDFDTHYHTRAVALALQQGYIETRLRQSLETRWKLNGRGAPKTAGPPSPFIAQRQQVKAAARSPLGVAKMVAKALRPSRWSNVCRRSWTAARIRRMFRRS